MRLIIKQVCSQVEVCENGVKHCINCLSRRIFVRIIEYNYIYKQSYTYPGCWTVGYEVVSGN